MKSLIIKDFLTIFCEFKIVMFFSALVGVISGLGEIDGLISFIPGILILLLPLQFFVDDERSGWLIYREFMPIERKIIVIERYLLSLLLFLWITVLPIIVSYINFHYINHFVKVRCISQLSLLLIIESLQFSITFKYGCEKAQIIFTMISAICGLIAYAIPKILHLNITLVSDYLEDGNIYMITLLLSIALYVMSARISICFFENRELS